MAREKHIVDLTIGNFKRFADFEVKNLGQFNLIVGDNNTGKTSFLEALLFDEDNINIFELLRNLRETIWRRSQEPTGLEHKKYVYENFSLFFNKVLFSQKISVSFWKESIVQTMTLRKFDYDKDLNILSPLEKDKLLSLNEKIQEFVLDLDNKSITSLGRITHVNAYYPFVPFGLGYSNDLIMLYSLYVDINKTTRDKFIERLKVLIPKVNDVRVGNDVINIYEERMETPMPLFTYGEGANKLFRILCEIAICKGKRLMIDEIDAGIHYSRFKSFWRTIMQAAKAYDVQIFATTHNIECVEYFREVLEEDAMKEYQDLARIVSLKVKEDNSVKARVYDYEYMEYAKDANRELRGGGL